MPKTFWEWITRPSLSVRILQEQIQKLEAENRRLNDLFVQQLELNRVIPRQAEHKTEVAEAEPPRLSRAEIEAEFLEESQRNYERHLAGVQERERQHRTLAGIKTEGVQ